MILQRADLLADGGGRHRQLVRRLGEREVPRGGIVNAQGVEGQERALHDPPSASQRAGAGQAGLRWSRMRQSEGADPELPRRPRVSAHYC